MPVEVFPCDNTDRCLLSEYAVHLLDLSSVKGSEPFWTIYSTNMQKCPVKYCYIVYTYCIMGNFGEVSSLASLQKITKIKLI